MYPYIMSHHTQITLSDSQYALLERESERTGMPLAALVRRALASTYGSASRDEAAEILAAAYGAWRDRTFDGAAYVDGLRRGMARRLDWMLPSGLAT